MAKVNVKVIKGKSTVEIDTDSIPVEVYQEALLLGLQVLVNRGTSKITKAQYPVAEELQAAAMEKAVEQVELINTGKIKLTGQTKAKKVSGAVMTEARRLARNIVKDAMKAAKIKISHVAAKDITAAANALLEERPELIEQAKTNIASREAAVEGEGEQTNKLLSLVKGIPIDQRKVAKDEAEKAKAKEQLSATQAGRPKARAKGAQPQAH